MKLHAALLPSGAALALVSIAFAQRDVHLNEVYLSHAGADDQEMIELIGLPGTPLLGFMVLVVEGDGTAAGTLDRAWDLSGFAVGASGYFVLGDAATSPDFVIGTTDSLENGTETVYLVHTQQPGAITALVGADITTGPYTTQIPGLSTIVDHVGVVDIGFPGTDRVFDFPIVLGPDGSFFPSGIYRANDHPNAWCATSFLDFDDVLNLSQPRTPGAANVACVPAGAPTVFAGITHTPLGNAGLSTGPGRLVVSNIGSSGQDGVSVALGRSEAFISELHLDPDAQLPGTGMQSSFLADVGGMPAFVGTLGLVRTSNGYAAIPDFGPLGSPTYTARVLDGDNVVFEQGGLSGPIGMITAVDIHIRCDCTPNSWCWRIDITITFSIAGANVQGDHVVFEADQAPPGRAFLQHVNIQGVGLGAMVIDDEALRVFGNDHYANGQAELAADVGQMEISNIGSSGQDGVDIQLRTGQDGFELELLPLHLVSSGQALSAAATGSFGGQPGTFLGTAGIGNAGGLVQASADFSAIGSSDVRVEVYDGGSLVGSAVVPGGGVVARIDPGPLGQARIIGCGKLPPDPPCFILILDRLAVVTPVGGGSLLGDELRLLAANANGSIDFLEVFTLNGTDLGQMTILNEGPFGPGCLGTNYCIGAVNSTGGGALLCATGSTSVSANDLVLTAAPLPVNQFGIFYYGPNQIQAPFGNGFRCVGGMVCRLPISHSGPTGTLVHQLDNTSPPVPSCQILAGSRRNFQAWYRDPAAGGAFFNLSDAVNLMFVP